MARNYPLEMVTPEKVVFSGDVTELIVPAHEGYLGVLAGHAPLLCTIKPGEVKVRTEGETTFYAAGRGFMEVSRGKTILLCEAVERVDEIDVERAEKARDRAKERLAEIKPDIDADRARSALARALNRIKTASRRS
ncbi:MAG: F0F1 ATP synthase subunit epsilon [Planctomycetota bacterium]|jgi:F-type H+-transporting ATPase subunit epsilon